MTTAIMQTSRLRVELIQTLSIDRSLRKWQSPEAGLPNCHGASATCTDAAERGF